MHLNQELVLGQEKINLLFISLHVAVVPKKIFNPVANFAVKAVKKLVTTWFPGVVVNVSVLLALSTSISVLLY